MRAVGVGLPSLWRGSMYSHRQDKDWRFRAAPSVRGKRGGPGQQERGKGSVISLCVFLALGVLFLNYFLVWLCWVLPVTLEIFSCDMWDLVP